MSYCFLGSFTHAIDAQRRVAVPREWRVSRDAAPMVFYLLPGREQTVHMLPGELFEQGLLEKAKRVSFANQKEMQALAQIGSRAARTVCDKQGRITLTHGLMEHAGLEDQAVLIGSFTSIQIMKPGTWASYEMGNEETLDLVEKIQGGGFSE